MKRRGGEKGIIRSSLADFLKGEPKSSEDEDRDTFFANIDMINRTNKPVPPYKPTEADFKRFKSVRAPLSRERPSINGGRTRRRRHRKTIRRNRQ